LHWQRYNGQEFVAYFLGHPVEWHHNDHRCGADTLKQIQTSSSEISNRSRVRRCSRLFGSRYDAIRHSPHTNSYQLSIL